MTTPKKGLRLGGPATPSTLEDPTPPELPARPGRQVVPAEDGRDVAVAPATEQPRPADDVAQGPVRLVQPAAAAPAGGARPTAAELLQPREEMRREQISVMVPEALQLRKRMRKFWANEDVEVRDQAAIAIDAWLTEQGY